MKRKALISLSLLAVLFSCHPMEDEAGEGTPGFLSITAALEEGSLPSAWPEDAVLDIIDDKGDTSVFKIESLDGSAAVFTSNAFPHGHIPVSAHWGSYGLPMEQTAVAAGVPDSTALALSGEVTGEAMNWNVTLSTEVAFLGFAFSDGSRVASITLNDGTALLPRGDAATATGFFKTSKEGEEMLVYYLTVVPGTYPEGLTVTLANWYDEPVQLVKSPEGLTLERGAVCLWSDTPIEFGVGSEIVYNGEDLSIPGEKFAEKETITTD